MWGTKLQEVIIFIIYIKELSLKDSLRVNNYRGIAKGGPSAKYVPTERVSRTWRQ